MVPQRAPAGACASRARGAPRELGIAMVGCGFMGRAHANAIRQVGHFFDLPCAVVPRVVVGRQLEEVAAARPRLGFAEASVELEAVLARDDIDIVDVATPNDAHAPIAAAALRAGKHVLCEKPLAMNLTEARALARSARQRAVRTGIWHVYRRCPAAALAQRIVARGELGEVRQVRARYLQDWLCDPKAPASWRTDAKRCGAGAHGDLSAHLIDMTMFLTGLRFTAVSALAHTFTSVRPAAGGQRRRVTVDDAFAFLARLGDRATGIFEVSRVAAGHKNGNSIEISGTRGALRWELERMNELELFTFDGPADTRGWRRILCTDPTHPYAARWWPDGHLLGYEHGFVHQLADFVVAIARRAPFAPDFEDGVRIQAVLDAALASAALQRWTPVRTQDSR